jgi:Polyketide cyclase / dehydrase and lipid transport
LGERCGGNRCQEQEGKKELHISDINSRDDLKFRFFVISESTEPDLRRKNAPRTFRLLLNNPGTRFAYSIGPAPFYNQWTQFEDFPHFTEGVEGVRQEGDKKFFWRAKIGGKVKEWEARITDQILDQRIAWESVDGSPNSGVVTFEAAGPDATQVTAPIDYEPEGFLEKAGDALGIPSAKVEGDLQRFRDYLEEEDEQQAAGGERSMIKAVTDCR